MSPIFTDDQLRNKDLSVLKRFLRFRLGGYMVAISDIKVPNLFYRGVRCPDLPRTIDRISFPPSDKVLNYGRLNRIGQSVFYASLGGPPVFFELRAKVGDLIALSEWETMEPLWMHHLGYHADALRRVGVSRLWTRSKLVHPIPNETKANARIRRQLSLAFTEDVKAGDEYRYKQSIAINELLFDGASPLPVQSIGPQHTRAAGTVYPALQMRGAADNVAIWPEFVRSSLKIRSVRFVRVEAADAQASRYTLVTLAISRDFPQGAIEWEIVNAPDRAKRSHIAFEGGEWILRNGSGEIYHRHVA